MAKSDKKKQKGSRQPIDNTPVTTDPRFASVHNDPRFNIPRRRDNKVKVDERFRPMLDDAAFARTANVDRYGRKIKDDSGRDAIRKLYTFEGEEDDDGDDDEDDNDGVQPTYDPARGEGLVSEEEEEESSDEEDVIEDEAEELLEAQKEADGIPLGDVTNRIAVVNLDWDHVRAVDLMATFSSFLPAGGKIKRICIYPSEFGKERMEREEMEGPPKELFTPSVKKSGEGQFKSMLEDEDEDDEEVTAETIVKEDKGEEVDSAKLRNYQLERLRYFYAIIECDTSSSANAIYKECDGVEYEATANFFDLRFVPDGTTFDDRPRDECSKALNNYKPNEFVTDALRASKVKLTWDQDDSMRKQVSKEAFSRRDIEDMDLKAYLASDSSESDAEYDGKEDAKKRYRELLNLSGDKKVSGEKKEKKPVGDMEVTFTSALSENKNNGEVFEKEETTLEKYQRKEKERRQKRKDKFKDNKAGVEEHSDQEMEVASEAEAPAEDQGFDDPFFEVDAKPAQRKEEKKKDRIKRREEKARDAAIQSEKRAELELIMQNDAATTDGDSSLQHYNMKNILKAEKLAKLKGKAAKRMLKKGVAEAEGLQDNYEIDVKDPRFSAIYENAEFAIDPTNPRFKKTATMEKVLHEKRRRREKGQTLDISDDERRKKKKRKTEKNGASTNLDALVRSVKGKSKRAV